MYVYPKHYDVIVLGGGHAGVEAALAAARMGCETLLLTLNLDSIGQMSCNPAIGGSAKGHLVREIDALGGEMGKAADMTGLQFRMLNTGRGPSVWAPRAQCDKKAYQFRLKHISEKEKNLDCKQGQASKLLVADGRVYGVQTSMEVQFLSQVVIVTTGTFLRGLMHIGSNRQAGGRAGDESVEDLSGSLRSVGLELGRLKTGTPPRLLRKSIDFSVTEEQFGDDPVPYFSFWRDDLFHVEHDTRVEGITEPGSKIYPPGSILNLLQGQLSCYITFTTKETASLVRENLHKSPLFSGAIEGIGPRYCPSIEDKIIRFSDKERHQVFLEPEGVSTDEIYVNGFSTCLPFEVQVELVRSIIGCAHAEIVRPAYAVEYDYSFPTQLHPSLETKVCSNLFLAGQINGTSGYEEAAAQGLMAGINAARRVQTLPPIILRRDQAYIGVLIDDLVTKGTSEPYRMFTSRAEYRLLLRQDNADLRLSQLGYEIGLLKPKSYRQFESKRTEISNELERLRRTRVGEFTLAELLRRPEVRYHELPNSNPLPPLVVEQIEINLKYEGYIQRQEADVARSQALNEKPIPAWMDYESIPSLRKEARQKLSTVRPATIGQAARISGVNPSDIDILLVRMKSGTHSQAVRSPDCNA